MNTLEVNDGYFEQPALEDDMSRKLPLKNTELTHPFKAYAVTQLAPSNRWAVVQLVMENNKIVGMKVFGHLEVEKQFAEETLMKVLSWEERFKI